MSDKRLRELKRAWQASGLDKDGATYYREVARARGPGCPTCGHEATLGKTHPPLRRNEHTLPLIGCNVCAMCGAVYLPNAALKMAQRLCPEPVVVNHHDGTQSTWVAGEPLAPVSSELLERITGGMVAVGVMACGHANLPLGTPCSRSLDRCDLLDGHDEDCARVIPTCQDSGGSCDWGPWEVDNPEFELRAPGDLSMTSRRCVRPGCPACTRHQRCRACSGVPGERDEIWQCLLPNFHDGDHKLPAEATQEQEAKS